MPTGVQQFNSILTSYPVSTDPTDYGINPTRLFLLQTPATDEVPMLPAFLPVNSEFPTIFSQIKYFAMMTCRTQESDLLTITGLLYRT